MISWCFCLLLGRSWGALIEDTMLGLFGEVVDLFMDLVHFDATNGVWLFAPFFPVFIRGTKFIQNCGFVAFNDSWIFMVGKNPTLSVAVYKGLLDFASFISSKGIIPPAKRVILLFFDCHFVFHLNIYKEQLIVPFYSIISGCLQ